ncbi:CHAT domain-containing tetratricopeptide repeat protein [Paraburkholderia sp. FT54]|uniref:CHAT domain-containing tetratricopeptide repeat protein n=1 Tax=Paraburkholderia sp. FT54 TaxID=3074437 RepID=UPI0028780D9A|nr:CHAT domain-containing tetratricopeptide repeat protein [Paraburkholderia sp. FT54]WNC94597.1 CHAT domain-containing tetratricopeptide repeat protein [Paraburkholderia sp. FT54]
MIQELRGKFTTRKGHRVSRLRRSIVFTGLGLALPWQARADADAFGQMDDLRAKLGQLLMPATESLRQNRAEEALPLLTQASALVEAKPDTQWPWRLRVNLLLGCALLGVGRNEEARRVLEQARAAEVRTRTERIEPYYGMLIRQDDEIGKMLFDIEFSKPMFTTLAYAIQGTQRAYTIDDVLFREPVSLADIPTTLARALVACRQPELLAELYRQCIENASNSALKAPSPGMATSPPMARIQMLLAQAGQSRAVDNEAFRRAMAVMAARMPPAAPEFDWSSLTNERRTFKFALLLARAGQRELADDAFRRALTQSLQRQREMAAAKPGYQVQLAGFAVSRAMTSARLGFRLSGPDGKRLPPDISAELIGLVVQNKGLGIRYVERMNLLLETSSNERTRTTRDQLHAIDAQLAALQPSKKALTQFMTLTMQYGVGLQMVAPDLRARGLDDVIVSGSALLPQVQAVLRDSVAIGYAQYETGAADGDGRRITTRYLRYCVSRDTVDLRDIGACREIDAAAFALRRAVLANSDWSAQSQLLAQSLLRDLPPSAANAKNWVIDPDGALSLVPFEVLPDINGQPLLLRRAIRYVTSLGQLTEDRPVTTSAGPACIVANPDYPSPDQASAGKRQPATRNFWLGDMEIPPLPDTANEARAVQSGLTNIGFRTRLFEHEAATPQALLNLDYSPPVVHVASHAVILESPFPADSGDAQNDRLAEAFTFPTAPDNAEMDRLDGAITDLIYPGHRAGLVLSGATSASIMFAKDISRLPLQQTQLAVLSSCDTGNGDIDVGEGVASLRRALEQAGAASSVTSLWPVPSEATVDLMAEFYRALSQGLPKSRALQQAKCAVRQAGHPASAWAAFLLAGSDSPLRKI